MVTTKIIQEAGLDDDAGEIKTHAKRAELYEYLDLHNKYAEKRRKYVIKFKNPLKSINSNDFYKLKTYMEDYKNGLIHNKVYDIRLKVPFSALFVGKSKSGKTTLLLDILNQWNTYTNDVNGEYFKRIYWIYGTENAKDFNKLNTIVVDHAKRHCTSNVPRTEFIKGDLKSEQVLNKIRNIPEQSIVILDDLMTEMVKSEEISNVLTRESHHKGWCVILLWQDMYPVQQFARTIALQCNYKYIFRDPARQDRLRTLCAQMFPNATDKKACLKRFGHISQKPLQVNIRMFVLIFDLIHHMN